MLKQIIAVFLMSLAIGGLYRIPRKLLLHACIPGVAAWILYKVIYVQDGNAIFAAFCGSVSAGVISEMLARLLKKPATIFIIPGFIPLVPGREAYLTMLYMVKGQYGSGVEMGMQTLLTGGAIAFGIFVSSTAYRMLMNRKVRG